MKQWELARYLIDAKKNVDSMIYISEHQQELLKIGLRDKVQRTRNLFYINCCIVLDKSVKKKDICATDTVIKNIYYERDKNGAHKDVDYRAKKYETISEIADEMKEQILHVRNVCRSTLPECLTLDFVSHDRELFRLVNAINSEQEKNIERKKYPYRDLLEEGNDIITKKVFSDTEDFREIPDEERNDYAVILEDGINQYEGLQNRQDGCIKINVLYDQNIWCSMNRENFELVEKMTKLGILNQYGRPIPIEELDDAAIAEIIHIAKEAGIENE